MTTYFSAGVFGAAYGALISRGYQLFNADGTANGARVVAGITERPAGSGTYAALVTLPDGFAGEVRWDTGGSPAKYASDFPPGAGVADALLGRNLKGGSDTGRKVSEALAALRNKVAFDVPAVGQFTVFDTDDATPLWTGAYTASAGAAPVTVLDPA